MKDKVVNKIMFNIKRKKKFDEIKLEEIKYGLLGVYTLITKTTVILLISIILGIFKEFIIFLIFYGILRGVGYGTHAKSNIACWIFSTLLLIGLPYIFFNIEISKLTTSIIWFICFINYLIFCPADTDKRPMINRIRKLKFKVSILIVSIIYLFIIIYVHSLIKMIVPALILEALLTNPLGYILMGQKVRFKLNDIHLFKQ